MNADLIKSILSVVGAAIPLLIIIGRAYGTRTEGTTGGLDSSRITPRKIERVAYTKKDFEMVYLILLKFYMKVFFITVAIVLGIEGLVFAAFYFFTASHSFTINIVSFLVFLLLCVIVQFLLISRNARIKGTDSVYDLFEDVIIIIEANYSYLFTKSHEALRRMKFHIETIDESVGSIIATKHPLFFGPLKKIHVTIKAGEEEKNTHLITVTYIYPRYALPPDEAVGNKEQRERMPRYYELLLTPERARVINRFLDLLLSKPTNETARAIRKVDTSNDGEE